MGYILKFKLSHHVEGHTDLVGPCKLAFAVARCCTIAHQSAQPIGAHGPVSEKLLEVYPECGRVWH